MGKLLHKRITSFILNKISAMKKLSLILALFLFAGTSFGQEKESAKPAPKPGDQIKQYWFVLIKTGPNKDADSASKAILFDKHMANITRLYNEGILKAAGPFGKNDKEWRGLFVFDCATREEAESYVQTDAAVAAGLFEVEITPWYTAPVGSFKKGKPGKAGD
jgi:uncharacterized protein YciI